MWCLLIPLWPHDENLYELCNFIRTKIIYLRELLLLLLLLLLINWLIDWLEKKISSNIQMLL